MEKKVYLNIQAFLKYRIVIHNKTVMQIKNRPGKFRDGSYRVGAGSPSPAAIKSP